MRRGGLAGFLLTRTGGDTVLTVNDDATGAISIESRTRGPERAGKVLVQALVIRWQGGGKITLQRFDRKIFVPVGERPSLTGPIARAKMKMVFGEYDESFFCSPGSVLEFVRFLLDPVEYKKRAGASHFVREMEEMQAGPASIDYRESLLPALVGTEISKLLIALYAASTSTDPDQFDNAMASALAQPQSSTRLWQWVESCRARSMVQLLLAMRIQASETPESALQRLTGKSNIVERLRVLPAAWIAHIVEYMPDRAQVRRQYFGELLPALKSLRQTLAAQPDCLHAKSVRFTAFCCHWMAHFREAPQTLGIGECSLFLTNHLNPSFGNACTSTGIDKRYMIRFLKLAVDALQTVQSDEAFTGLQRSTMRIARWLAGSNARINPELLRQARFERLLEHAKLWRIELYCSSTPWDDCLAPLDAMGGAVWVTKDVRHHRTFLFLPVRSHQDLVQVAYRFRNCLRDKDSQDAYRIDCLRGHTRLYQINSEAGKALALMCLDWSLEKCRWVVGECKGVGNTQLSGFGDVIGKFLAHYNRIQPHPHRAVV